MNTLQQKPRLSLWVTLLFAGMLIIGASCGGGAANTNTTADTTSTATNVKTLERLTGDSTKIIELPDGSKVSLNRGSSVSYPEKFDGAERNVTLKGEGYFEVKKNSSKKFNVYAGNTKTVVVGTSFNLRAYETEDTVALDVIEGEVSFVELDSKEQPQSVTAEERVVYRKANRSMRKERRKGLFLKWWANDIQKIIEEKKKNIEDIGKNIKDIFKKDK